MPRSRQVRSDAVGKGDDIRKAEGDNQHKAKPRGQAHDDRRHGYPKVHSEYKWWAYPLT